MTGQGAHGVLYTVEDFKRHVETGGFTDDDGWGCAVRDGILINHIHPSDVDEISDSVTHVLWFDR